MKKIISILFALSLALAITVVAFAAANVWSVNVEDYSQGSAYSGSISSARSDSNAVLGMPDNNGSDETTFYSLGKEGYVIVKLSDPVDTSLEVYEATWGCNAGYANEIANVYVSPDGVDWSLLGTADNKSDKTCYNGSGFVSPFELNGQCIQYVKVEDAGAGTLGDGFDVDAIGGEGICQFVITVDIDIKPGSDPSCFNNDGNGVIPVAILGSADFDVTTVDPGTVQLEGLAVAAKGKSNKLLAAIEDVNNDGYLDLVIKIEDVDGTFTQGSGMATLTGNLYDGTPIIGYGDICITQ